MYQSFVYLETRIQIPEITDVFSVDKKTKKVSINDKALQNVFLLANALNSSIPETSILEKLTGNIPKKETGKEITGYSVKLAEGGAVNIIFHSKKKSIHIKEIRLEEDTGRLTHADGNTHMDFTHAGSASIRVHTTPSFETGEEAELFLEELCRLLQYLNITQTKPKDLIRSTAFVSLAEYPELPDYYIKLRNLNSFNFVRKAINYELTRQEAVLSKGEPLLCESRLWNESKSTTDFFHQRKEILRRFENENPEQIIPTTKHNERLLKNKTKIELPAERRERFKNQYKLDAVLCEQLCDDKNLADFFEETVKLSNAPETTARLLLQEVKRLLKISSIDIKNSNDIKNSKLTEKNFSKIIELLEKKKIHNVTAKRLIKETLENGSSPEDILTQLNLTELSSKKELLPYIQKVVKENSLICEKIKQGEISKVEYLTGLVMKETENKALPQIVKTLLKEELGMNTVYILSMGGAFSAVMHSDGIVASGDSSSIRSLAAKCAKDVPVQIISIAQFLSEELEPNDWAILIAEISRIINSSMAKGIVITHGCDTLSYTASLLFWLFSDSTIPIVLTASSELPGKSKEAEENLSLAIKTSTTKKSGVYVAFDKKLLSPLNLRFTSLSKSGFRNWNLAKPIFTKSGPIAEQFSDNSEYDKKVLERLLVDASGRMLTCKVYPGFRSDVYRKLLTNKIHSVFLELYESGAGNMRSNDFSLKPFLLYGKEKNIRFYCTSQQESNAGFTQYATSHRIWREGAVPMGSLSIESSITLYFACSLVSDTEQELDELMDTYSKLYE